MFKKIIFVLLVVFLGIGLIGCKNSQSDSDALIQFLKNNPHSVMVEAYGEITKVIPEQREITLEQHSSLTESTTVTIIMTQNAKLVKQTISKENHLVEEETMTLEQVAKNEIGIGATILLEAKNDHWEGKYLVVYH